LLTLPETQAPLTPQDRQFVIAEIEKYKIKYNELKKFYESRASQSKIEKLPKAWFHTENILQAMKERIQRLETAANDPKIKTLCDLALTSQPNLRFHHAMSYLYEQLPYMPGQHSYGTYLNCMNNIGYNALDKCIYECSKSGIDPQLIKQLYEDPNLSFEEVIAKISTDTKIIPYRIALEYAHLIVQQLKSASLHDFKDYSLPPY